MGQHDLADAGRDGAQLLVPGALERRGGTGRRDDQVRDHGVQQGLLAGVVPVQRACAHAEPARQQPHGEAVQADLVEQFDRRLKHLGAPLSHRTPPGRG